MAAIRAFICRRIPLTSQTIIQENERAGLAPLLSLLLKGRDYSDSLNQKTALALCTMSTMKSQSSLQFIDEQERSDFNS